MSTNQNIAVPTPGTFRERVTKITQDLIRIDTTNFGNNDSRGEREAAEYCFEIMKNLDMNPEIVESEPGRATVIGRVSGWDAEAEALMIHGHLDVVPAEAEDWSVDPFSAEIIDDMIWGRGAVDMKGMNAMMLALFEYLYENNLKPRREIVLCFFSDEEAGGTYGAHWLVENRPELFDGVTEAISEVGGFSTEIAGQRAYLLQTAEKGIAWLDLHLTATPGHGSSVHPDNAVTYMAQAIAKVGEYQWPLKYTKTTRDLMEQVAEMMGVEFDENDPTPQLEAMGSASKFVGSTLRNSTNPTGLTAGYKHNVIPGRAAATVDARVLPGDDELVIDTVQELVGDRVNVEFNHRIPAVEVPFSGDFVEHMIRCIQTTDPEAKVLPFMMSGGTDNNALSALGIAGYGFMPLQLPTDLDFTALFHGIDERIPIDSLDFGTRTLFALVEPQAR